MDRTVHRQGTRIRILVVALQALLMALVTPLQAWAGDSRTDYLIDMLENSTNFRSRVQAVETLGQICSGSTDEKEKKTIMAALSKAALDKNEAVRLMVAATLGVIGDPSALPTLEKLTKDNVSEVASQAQASIDKINKKTSAGDDTASLLGLEAQDGSGAQYPLSFYVGIGSWADGKVVEFKDLDPKNHIKETIKKKLSKLSAVMLQPDGATSTEVKTTAKKKNLTAYTLTGSVSKIELDEQKNEATAKLQMVVLTGDGNMSMMLSATGAATVESKGEMNDQRRKDLVYSAISSAVGGLMEDLWGHLKTEIKPIASGNKGGKGGKGKKKGK